MIRILLFSISLIGSVYSSACPACNIHNYLYPSVHTSKNIYIGKVIDTTKSGQAKVEVLSVIRTQKRKSIKVGDILKESLYAADERIGEEFIFSDPSSFGLKFPDLSVRYEWEVRYLADTTRIVSSAEEAIKLLECASRHSNKDGSDYIKSHYSECYDQLTKRIVEFRKECQLKTDDFLNAYRLSSLVAALSLMERSENKQFFLNELDSVALFDTGLLKVDSFGYNGKSSMGEYIREILRTNKETDFYEELVSKCLRVVNTCNTSNATYFTYALAFENQSSLDEISLTEKNREYVTLGVLCAALWNRAYYQRDEIPPLLSRIKKLNTDPEIESFVTKRFDQTGNR